ncbi:hypothetical protein BKA63DRAFT_584486 [Paraphoma chrysanthemicola]|nr:hypothetical protein BKA63DRAFT_584486 [Paraphoma chrysanthemicola]
MGAQKPVLRSIKDIAVRLSSTCRTLALTQQPQLSYLIGHAEQPTQPADPKDEMYDSKGRDKRMSGGGHNSQNRPGRLPQIARRSQHTKSELIAKIAMLEGEIGRQDHRYSSMRGHMRRLQEDLKEAKDRVEDQTNEHRVLKERYQTVLDKAVILFARSKGIAFNLQTGEPLTVILNRMLQDASRAESSQADTQSWQKRLQASQGQTRVYSEEVRQSHGLIEELRHQLQIKEAETENSRQRAHKSQAQNQALMKQVEAMQVQEDAMHARVQDVQREMLGKVEKTQAVSDDQLSQDFRTLISMIKALSRMINFDASTNVVETLKSYSFLEHVSPQHWQGRAQKKRFIEAWIWSVLYIDVFDTPFKIFGTFGNGLAESWFSVYGEDHVLEWPTPSLKCELWRYTTTEQLVESVGKDLISHGRKSLLLDDVEASVVAVRKDIGEIVCTSLCVLDPAADAIQIGNVVDKAFTLAMQMFLQRSRLQITYPQVGDKFIHNEMTFLPDRNGNDIEDGLVAYVLNPGLAKWGNAHGEQYECRLDLVPSLVQLESVDIKRESF